MASCNTSLENLTVSSAESIGRSSIVIIATYVVIGVFGLVGNILVMTVFWLLRKQQTQVNKFIFNQALIDACCSVLLITYGIMNVYRPHIMAVEQRVDNSSMSTNARNETGAGMLDVSCHFMKISRSTAEFLCRFWWSRFFIFACFAISTWNLTVMSIERYFAVLRPLTYKRDFSRKHTNILMALVWLIAPVFEYPYPILQHTSTANSCDVQKSWTFASGAVFGIITFVWQLALPATIMAFVYIRISRKLRSTKQKCTGSPARGGDQCDREAMRTSQRTLRNITATLFILFTVYVVCWLPNEITFLQYNLGGDLDTSGIWYQFTVTMAFLNCCVNPFIYALRLNKFKKGVRMLIGQSVSSEE